MIRKKSAHQTMEKDRKSINNIEGQSTQAKALKQNEFKKDSQLDKKGKEILKLAKTIKQQGPKKKVKKDKKVKGKGKENVKIKAKEKNKGNINKKYKGNSNGKGNGKRKGKGHRKRNIRGKGQAKCLVLFSLDGFHCFEN